MKRRDLIKGLGAIGVGSMLSGISAVNVLTAKKKVKTVLPTHKDGMAICWLTPEKTEGPYYFNANLVRQDIRYNTSNNEFHDGIQLNMTFTVIDIDCKAIPGVLVDIWHADRLGCYSGYNQPCGNFTGQDFMRGIQVTDGNGQCSFITSYPGWYPGRATHIHFKVRLNSSTYVTSQFCFLDSVNNAVYATPLYVQRGPNPVTNAMDMVFMNPDPPYLRMTAVQNGNVYDGTFTIGSNNPIGIIDPSSEVKGFSLEQNYPNPFNPATKIAYTIPEGADVKLEVYDIFGKEVKTLVNKRQSAGRHEVVFDGTNYASGYYFYKLTAGKFTQAKEMLMIK